MFLLHLDYLDYDFGDEAGIIVAKALERNTTLTRLNLFCMSKIGDVWISVIQSGWSMQFVHFSGSSIGDKGARSLAKALMQNKTLTQLNLESRYEANM